ncbi:MAG: plasmid partitioning protein RepB [Chelatococcus sp.]|uniref:plasmid partitioning protein RepB n=1 Tax=Chelatococcus sp. TaxID=1953771 RepID=UPI0025C5D7F3|nr:plasmid partitioning protein RepB [Chelatococcus sp.]MBX3538428.1 plasmid partitioning protein RepB [Chelatococcus sp.]
MSRKRIFATLDSTATSAADSATPEAPVRLEGRPRSRPLLGVAGLAIDPNRSPVGAIGQSLGEVSERTRRADEIERKLSAGQTIVELDPAEIDPSFVTDRMPVDDDVQRQFVASIRDQGQQVPILVRPHPEARGRYQVAFGHRRLKAAIELGLRVRAVVRDLSDEELVVAQGQENNERRDLTFIEKARFARNLQSRFTRDVIMAAMSIYKSDLSNMLSVVTRIPDELVDAIGPAHGIGRRNWIELADLLSRSDAQDRATALVRSNSFAGLSSDARFKAVLAALKPKSGGSREPSVWTSRHGSPLARVEQSERKLSVTIDRRQAPEFADFVLNELPRLYAEYESRK